MGSKDIWRKRTAAEEESGEHFERGVGTGDGSDVDGRGDDKNESGRERIHRRSGSGVHRWEQNRRVSGVRDSRERGLDACPRHIPSTELPKIQIIR